MLVVFNSGIDVELVKWSMYQNMIVVKMPRPVYAEHGNKFEAAKLPQLRPYLIIKKRKELPHLCVQYIKSNHGNYSGHMKNYTSIN